MSRSRWSGGAVAWIGWPVAFRVLMTAVVLVANVSAHAAERVVSMQAFGRDQGLGNLAAQVLLRDRDRVLWVGTDRGVYRFDGHEFVALGGDASRLSVNDLYQGSDGRVWVGAARGLYVWEHGHLRAVAQVPVTDLRRIAGDGADGVYVRHHRRLVHVGADERVRDVHWPQALSSGALTDGPLAWYRHRLWTSCGTRLCTRGAGHDAVWGPDQGVPDDHWITLHVDGDGGLWVGGDHHLLHLAAGERRFRVVDSDDPIETITVDAQGRVLAGTAGHISRWDGERWQGFSDRRALQSAQIRDLLFDPAGSVWVATGGRGVLRWRGYGQFQNWFAEQGLDSAPTWAIARDADGRLWLGNQRHGNLLVPGRGHLSPWPAAMQRKDWTSTTALLAHGRQMWVVFNAGTVVRYDLDSHRAQSVLMHAGWTKFGFIDGHDRLWIGTHGALWRIDDIDAAKSRVQRMATGLPADTNYLGVSDGPDGSLWFATSHGLLHFADGRFTHAQLPATMPSGGLVDVAADDHGRLWLAPVAGGLWLAGKGDAVRLDARKVDDALIGDTRLYSLEIDRQGRLWAGSDAGIDVHADGRWRRLDEGDGLVWDDMATGAFHQDADGSVWLGTSGGVSHVLHPQHLFSLPPLHAPTVLRIRYGDHAVVPGLTPRRAWNGKALSVSLATTDDLHGAGIAIEYRLRKAGDSSTAWEVSKSRRLRYAALAPGDYRFQARVFDPALRERSPPSGFSLVVTPPWWRTGWAYASAALGLMALVWLAWRWRNVRLLRRQVLLERLVAERTRDLEADKRELQMAHRALEYEASHDALTGLLNRGAAVGSLAAAWANAIDRGHALALVLIDLDHFKQVNDTHGHLAGDAVLVQCAQRFRTLMPEGAALGRFGGEELMGVWPGLDRGIALARHFAPLVDGEYRDGEQRLRVTCSIGVAWARPGDDVDSLLRRADDALYRAKAAGRARVERDDG